MNIVLLQTLFAIFHDYLLGVPFEIDSEERQEKAEKEIKENIKIRKDIDLQRDGMHFLASV